jgi:2-keto-4-pentenoate hydratase/2-oxohepta-3-ene-1,7-dioic acid hydratase in catechol pathway
MKLVSYTHGDRARWGAVVGERDDGVVDLGARMTGVGSLAELLAAGALEAARAIVERTAPDLALADVTLDKPVPRPGKIICIGVNYAERNEEYRDGSERPRWPSLFMRTPGSLVAHGEPIVRPPESVQLDYEGEIAIVVGRAGRRIPREQAARYVGGLTCMNEGTIRDWLRHGKFNVTQGKNFERTGSIGPWLVTADAFGGFDDLRVSTRVNGELRQDDTTARLMFPFDMLIAYLSTFMRLEPGDVISTGTPTGAGAHLDPPRWLVPGDRVEVAVSGVGVLANPVIDEVA